jgi:hypothetical protein
MQVKTNHTTQSFQFLENFKLTCGARCVTVAKEQGDKPMNKPRSIFGFKLFLLATLLAIGLAIGLIWGGDIRTVYNNYRLSDVFTEQRLAELHEKALAIIAKAGGEDKAPAATVRAGKAVFINKNVRVHSNRNEVILKLDSDHGRLPAALRADSPGEADMVVICRPHAFKDVQMDYKKLSEHSDKMGNKWVLVQRTERRSSDWSETLDVHLVDIKNNRYLGRTLFVWDVERDPASGAGEAKRDSKKLMDWYAGLSEK